MQEAERLERAVEGKTATARGLAVKRLHVKPTVVIKGEMAKDYKTQGKHLQFCINAIGCGMHYTTE